jgi:hypothetical protein
MQPVQRTQVVVSVDQIETLYELFEEKAPDQFGAEQGVGVLLRLGMPVERVGGDVGVDDNLVIQARDSRPRGDDPRRWPQQGAPFLRPARGPRSSTNPQGRRLRSGHNGPVSRIRKISPSRFDWRLTHRVDSASATFPYCRVDCG